MKNLTLTQRISAGFVLVIFMLGIIVWTANNALEGNQAALENVVNVQSEKIKTVARMVQNLVALQRAEKNLILAKSQGEMAEYQLAISEESKELKQRLRATSTLVDQEGSNLLEQFEGQYNAFRATQQKVIELTRQNANVRARELSQGKGREAYDRANEAMRKIVELNDRRGGRINREVDQSGSKVKLSARTVQDLLAISRAERNLILAKNQEEMDEYAAFIALARNEMKDRRDQLRELVDDEGKAILDEFSEVWEQFLSVDQAVRDLTRENGNVKARELSQGDARETYDNAVTAMKKILDLNDQENDRLNRAVDESGSKVKLAARINQDLISITRAEKNLILAKTQKEMDQYAAAITQFKSEMKERREQLRAIVDDEGKDILDQFARTVNKLLEVNAEVQVLTRRNSNVKARDISQESGRDAFDKATIALKRLVDLEDKIGDASRDLPTAKASAERLKLAARINRNLVEMQRGEKNLILARTQQEMDEYAKAITVVQNNLEERKRDLQPLLEAQSLELMDEFDEAYEQYLTIHTEVRELSRENSNVKAFDLASEQGRPLADQAELLMARITNKNDKEQSELLKELGNTAEKIKLAARINRNLTEVQRGEKNLIIARSQQEMDQFAEAIEAIQADLENRSKELEPLLNEADKRLFDRFQSSYESYNHQHQKVRALSRQNSNAKAFDLASGEGRTLSDRGELLLSRVTNKNDRELTAQLKDLARANDKMKLAARINRNLTEIQRDEKNIILANTQQEMDEYARNGSLPPPLLQLTTV
ncbi:MAG: hypothetical protein HOD58_04975 [Gammaproteobacteria bacterium]|jgi:hypothetical protein|nr:hypothetical protein [Gammaproteobacteria bacterium]MBT4329264.1 hypothetical protein [Gammaproteobacteria bacterium]MBT5636830.1 hypothetical protein [Gammaproteobacteria bacterium]